MLWFGLKSHERKKTTRARVDSTPIMSVRSFPRFSELPFLLYFIRITLKNEGMKYTISNPRKTNVMQFVVFQVYESNRD